MGEEVVGNGGGRVMGCRTGGRGLLRKAKGGSKISTQQKKEKT